MINSNAPRGRARLLGIGRQTRDDHRHYTQGEHFRLYNGDARVHDRMQKKALEFLRRVEARGLSMENISREECRVILAELGLQEEELITT